MFPPRIILALVLLSLITISCMVIVLIDWVRYEVDDPVTVDPHKISGTWYVLGAITADANRFPKFRCWAVEVTPMHPDSYSIRTTFIPPMSNMKRRVQLAASLSNQTVYLFDNSKAFRRSVMEFMVYHAFNNPNLLFLSMIGDPEFYSSQYIILGTKLNFTDEEKTSISPQVYINNTGCG